MIVPTIYSTEPLHSEFRNFECPSKIFRKDFTPGVKKNVCMFNTPNST